MTSPRCLGRYTLVAPSERRLHLAFLPRAPADLVVVERAVLDVAGDLPRADRVLREASQLTAFESPGLLRLRDAFLARVGPATALCFVHEYAPGVLLSSLVREARRRSEAIPVPVAVTLAARILEALEPLHAGRSAGPTMHLRLSPGNVLVGNDGLRLRGLSEGLPSWPNAWISEEQRGDFRYLTPEQARGEPPSPRSDLFQVGALLWEMLAGRPRVDAADLLGMLGQLRHLKPKPLRPARGDVPEPLDRLLQQALAQHPPGRPESARAFLDALAQGAPRAPWVEVERWASALGAEPFPGPEVYLRQSATEEDEPPSSRPQHGTYRG